MTKYLLLSESVEPKVIGVKNGLGQLAMAPDFEELNSWHKEILLPTRNPPYTERWKKIVRLLDYAQDTPGLLFEKGAKKTDFMETPFSQGYIVNSKAREVLETCHLPRHAFFRAFISQGDTINEDYWWLAHDLETGLETVDFEKSLFDLEWHHANYKQNIIINSYDDYINLFYKSGRAATGKRLVFNKNFDSQLDLWGTLFLSIGRGYASERLLTKLEHHKITGYEAGRIRCEFIFEK